MAVLEHFQWNFFFNHPNCDLDTADPLWIDAGIRPLYCEICLSKDGRDGSARFISQLPIFTAFLFKRLCLCYFPFLQEPPVLYYAFSNHPANLKPWKQVFAALCYSGFEVVMPITNVITDFIFSFQLYEIYQDPLLLDRDELYTWVNISFVSSCCGALFEIIKQSVEFWDMISQLKYEGDQTYVGEITSWGSPQISQGTISC